MKQKSNDKTQQTREKQQHSPKKQKHAKNMKNMKKCKIGTQKKTEKKQPTIAIARTSSVARIIS